VDARTDRKLADVPAAAGRKGFKAELDGLRERMRGLGFPYDEIAAGLARTSPEQNPQSLS
jgi:hypothetical protein